MCTIFQSHDTTETNPVRFYCLSACNRTHLEQPEHSNKVGQVCARIVLGLAFALAVAALGLSASCPYHGGCVASDLSRGTKSRTLIWRFRLIINIEHASLLGRFIISLQHTTLLGFRFIIYLKHAPLRRLRFIIYLKTLLHLAIPNSSYILINTPRHVAIPVHHISTTRLLIWRFWFLITSTTRLLIWRFLLIIYLAHAFSFGDCGSSYILNTPPRLATPAHPVS